MDTVLLTTRMAVVDQYPMALQRTLASILHYSIRLLWICHTGKGLLLDEARKETMLAQLHALCDEFEPGWFSPTTVRAS